MAKLTALGVQKLKQPGRYGDGDGLYVDVGPTGSKAWLLRVRAQGRRCDMGLGSVSLVTLAEARDEAHRWRKVALAGGDPVAERAAERAAMARPATVSFEAAARAAHLDLFPDSAGYDDAYREEWIRKLELHAFPVAGRVPVADFTTDHAAAVLRDIWTIRGETAKRVKQRMHRIFQWCRAKGYRAADAANPCELVGSLLSRRQPKVQHFAALPWAHVPVFVKRLRESDCKLTTRLAFELLILTAARTGEIIGARPEEFDLDARVWTLPAARMKMARPHRVPLSERAVELVRRAMEHAGLKSQWLFPGVRGQHLSNMAFLRAIRRAGMAGKITAHGFRSSFKSWATALDVAPRIAVELALAHQIKGKDAVSAVEGVYLSDDLLELRASLMATWAWYVTTGEAPAERLPPVRRRTKAQHAAA